jgi:hypothetical protein
MTDDTEFISVRLPADVANWLREYANDNNLIRANKPNMGGSIIAVIRSVMQGQTISNNVGQSIQTESNIGATLDERVEAALEAKIDFLIGNISMVADEQYERLVGVVAQNMIDIDERIDTHIEAAQQSLRSGDGGRLTEIFDRIRVLEVATTAQTQGMEIGIQDVQNMIDVAFSDREERLDSLEEIVRDAISALARIEAIFDMNSPLIARIEPLENNLSEEKVIHQKATDAIPESEGDSNPEITESVLEPEPLPIIEAIENIAAPSIEKSLDSEGLSEAIAATVKPILTRPEALAIAKSFNPNVTGQNLYDWSKAALTAKSGESKLANSEKLAAVGLVAILSSEKKPSWKSKG